MSLFLIYEGMRLNLREGLAVHWLSTTDCVWGCSQSPVSASLQMSKSYV